MGSQKKKAMKTGGIFIILQTNKHVKKNSDKGERVNEVIFRSKMPGVWDFSTIWLSSVNKTWREQDFFQGVVSGARVEIWDDMRWLHTSNIYFMSSSETRISFVFQVVAGKRFPWVHLNQISSSWSQDKDSGTTAAREVPGALRKVPLKDFKRPMILRKCDVMILEILVSFMFMPIHANLKPEVHFLWSYDSHILSARFLVRLVPRPGATL